MNEQDRRLSAQTIANLLIDTEPYLSCDDCFARIDQYVEGRIDDPSYDDVRMRTHLDGCGVCAEEASTLEALLREDAQ